MGRSNHFLAQGFVANFLKFQNADFRRFKKTSSLKPDSQNATLGSELHITYSPQKKSNIPLIVLHSFPTLTCSSGCFRSLTTTSPSISTSQSRRPIASSDLVYRHPWHRVTAAAWRKFTDPPAPASLSHILDVETLSRHLDPNDGRLQAVRAIAGRPPPLPFLLRPLVASLGAGDVVLCVERTTVDAAARTMDVVYRNATFRRVVDVEERCSYAPHPERPDEWTLFTQETSIRCAPLAAVSATVAEMVERRCAESFAQNAAEGTEVVERICQGMAEGEK